MGALSKTIKTLKKMRSTFLKLAKKFEASGMLLTDPRVTDDGHSVANVYLLDENGKKTDKVCIAVKYFSEDVGGGTRFYDVSFLKAGNESQATPPIKRYLYENELQQEVEKQIRKWYANDPEVSSIFEEMKKRK